MCCHSFQLLAIGEKAFEILVEQNVMGHNPTATTLSYESLYLNIIITLLY